MDVINSLYLTNNKPVHYICMYKVMQGMTNIHMLTRDRLSPDLYPVDQDFFQEFFRAVLNLELSFETQSSHQSFSAGKMKLFEL